MGIRIHKVIGYGLDDVMVENGKIVDDRFYDQSAFMMEDNSVDGIYESPENVYSKDGFLKYLKSHIKWPCIEAHMIKNCKWDFYHNFVREWEGQYNNVFIVVPPGHDDWQRYDDIIDYIEEERGIKLDRLKKLQQGIWPYSSIHQNQYGQQLNPGDSCRWWRVQNNVLDGNCTQEDLSPMILLQDLLSKKLGFKNFHDARDNMAPLVPDIVKAFCRYTNIFNDPDTVYQLRPMLFVYWA